MPSGTITSCQTCSLTSSLPTGPNNYGCWNFSIRNNVAGVTIAGLQQWDLSSLSIPTGASITKAELSIVISGGAGNPTDIFEAVGGNTIDPTQATWNDKATGVPWTAPGGDYGPLLDSPIVPVIPPQTYTVVDILAAVQNAVAGGYKPSVLFMPKTGQSNTIQSEFATLPNLAPQLYVEWTVPTTRADLGTFMLGYAALGAGPMRGDGREYITITEEDQVRISINLQDNILIIENLNGATYAYFTDSLTISETVNYLSDYLAGVKGTITVPLDLQNENFCEMVQETGQQFALNGVVERAFIFTKQIQQKFDLDVRILPGDAVMFGCPDLVVEVGDEVVWDGKVFTVAEAINHYFANTVIYVKYALQRG